MATKSLVREIDEIDKLNYQSAGTAAVVRLTAGNDADNLSGDEMPGAMWAIEDNLGQIRLASARMAARL